MELDELKTTWQSIKPGIKSIEYSSNDEVFLKKKSDVKSRLLRKLFIGEVLSGVCLILMATSRIWAVMKFPYWWISIFCLILLISMSFGIMMWRKIQKINLFQDSNTKILETVITLKKFYRNIELVTCILLLPLLLWISFIPSFIYTWKMIFAWSMTSFGFILEYLWYKSNMKQINNLVDFKNEQ